MEDSFEKGQILATDINSASAMNLVYAQQEHDCKHLLIDANEVLPRMFNACPNEDFPTIFSTSKC
jgi:hypothetical protein